MVNRNNVSFKGEKKKRLLLAFTQCCLTPASWNANEGIRVLEKLFIFLHDAEGEIACRNDSSDPSGKWVQLSPHTTAQPSLVEMLADLEICAWLLRAEDLVLREHKATFALAHCSREGRREKEERNNPGIQSKVICPVSNPENNPGRKNNSFWRYWDFPGSLVVKTLRFHCRGLR